ncbi:hypothetical protein ACEPAH_1990 [Sanghuangporus vaninii]
MSSSLGFQSEMSSFDLQNHHAPSQAPSIASLRILPPQNNIISLPATAATSMLTVCPAEDEKDNTTNDGGLSGPSGEGEQQTNDDSNSNPLPVPQVALTFLLVSGARRTMTFDPETTVGRVKELVWNGWPNDWQEEKPPAPNFLRILYLGKILQDEDTLSSLSIPTLPSPVSSPTTPTSRRFSSLPATIVHLSIRPYAPPAEDEALIKKNLRAARRALSRSGSTMQPPVPGGATNDEARSGGCCGCVIC